MLNATQKTAILSVISYYVTDILGRFNNQYDAFNAILAMTDNVIYAQYQETFVKQDALSSIDEMRRILQHQHPQNLTYGEQDFAGNTINGVLINEYGVGTDGNVYRWNPQNKNEIIYEPEGLLNLTNLQQPNETPVTTQEVREFITNHCLKSYTDQLRIKPKVKLHGIHETSTSSTSKSKSSTVKFTFATLDFKRMQLVSLIQQILEPFNTLRYRMNGVQLIEAIALLEAALIDSDLIVASVTIPVQQNDEYVTATASVFQRFSSRLLVNVSTPLNQLFIDEGHDSAIICYYNLKNRLTPYDNNDNNELINDYRLISTGEIHACITRLIERYHILLATGFDSDDDRDDDNDDDSEVDINNILQHRSPTVFMNCLQTITQQRNTVLINLIRADTDYQIRTNLADMLGNHFQQNNVTIVIPILYPYRQFAAVVVRITANACEVINLNLFGGRIPSSILATLNSLSNVNVTEICPTPCVVAAWNRSHFATHCLPTHVRYNLIAYRLALGNNETGPAVIDATERLLSGTYTPTNHTGIVHSNFRYDQARQHQNTLTTTATQQPDFDEFSSSVDDQVDNDNGFYSF